MSIRYSIAALGAVAALGATLADFGTPDSAGASVRRDRCEIRCRGNAACLRECENYTEVQPRRPRRVIVIRIPPPEEEPPVAKSWVGPVFNPSTGGGGGGGGGGAGR